MTWLRDNGKTDDYSKVTDALTAGWFAVVLSNSKRWGIVSRFIRWLTKSKASHASMLYHDEMLAMPVIMEADQAGYHTGTPFARWLETNQPEAIITIPASIGPAVREIGRRYLGTAYDFRGMFGEAARTILGRLRIHWRNRWQRTRQVFCSEAVVAILREAQYPGAEALSPHGNNAQTLWEFFGCPN